jgi:hypothetical protein
MPHLDARGSATLPASIGAGALLAGCLVFDGKSVPLPDASPESSMADASEASIAPDPGIRCGANEWCPTTTVCCTKLGASGWFTPSTACNAPGTCANFSQFSCDTARECGDGGVLSGESCCATRESATTEFQGSSCVPFGACAPASLAIILCVPGDPTACPAQQSCVAADAGELPPGYHGCQ